jgi:hypothetical protein
MNLGTNAPHTLRFQPLAAASKKGLMNTNEIPFIYMTADVQMDSASLEIPSLKKRGMVDGLVF